MTPQLNCHKKSLCEAEDLLWGGCWGARSGWIGLRGLTLHRPLSTLATTMVRKYLPASRSKKAKASDQRLESQPQFEIQ